MSTTKKNLNKEIIALFSGQASIITTPKLYIQLTGSYCLAQVLNQIVFYSNKSELKNGWFYKSYNDWFKETLIPERTMRHYLRILEKNNWVETKVKKINDKNTSHVRPNMDAIIDAISVMLDTDCPNRQNLPNEAGLDLECCTKVAPTGKTCRSETAKLADSSIYTEENLQITTNCQPSSSSFQFSETTDKNLLNQKLDRDNRNPQEFLKECVDHVDNFSDKKFPRLQRANALVKLLKQLKESNTIFREKDEPIKPKQSSDPTRPSIIEFQEYRAGVRGYEFVGEWLKINSLWSEKPQGLRTSNAPG